MIAKNHANSMKGTNKQLCIFMVMVSYNPLGLLDCRIQKQQQLVEVDVLMGAIRKSLQLKT